mmetsp:Transcript_6833/g.27970  ORF Transcript_6833/g.27970 Transcript_6833/m.27970 type:complete len:376 (+) Transcript_6833:156-1283(+)
MPWRRPSAPPAAARAGPSLPPGCERRSAAPRRSHRSQPPAPAGPPLPPALPRGPRRAEWLCHVSAPGSSWLPTPPQRTALRLGPPRRRPCRRLPWQPLQRHGSPAHQLPVSRGPPRWRRRPYLPAQRLCQTAAAPWRRRLPASRPCRARWPEFSRRPSPAPPPPAGARAALPRGGPRPRVAAPRRRLAPAPPRPRRQPLARQCAPPPTAAPAPAAAPAAPAPPPGYAGRRGPARRTTLPMPSGRQSRTHFAPGILSCGRQTRPARSWRQALPAGGRRGVARCARGRPLGCAWRIAPPPTSCWETQTSPERTPTTLAAPPPPQRQRLAQRLVRQARRPQLPDPLPRPLPTGPSCGIRQSHGRSRGRGTAWSPRRAR